MASAGTGKTTSLVLRYLELIGTGTPLRRIAGVTFTRKAADELRQRVGAALEDMLRKGGFLEVRLSENQRPAFEEALRELDGATLTTIHGFMIESLRLVAPMMSIDPDFNVLGEWEAQALFEEELNSLFYLANEPGHGLYSQLELLGKDARALLLTLFKQRSLSQHFETDEHPKNSALRSLFERLYKAYEIRLGATLLPPSEVERRALKVVQTAPALKRLAERFKLVLVDEFQDVNPLQGKFFEALEQGGLNVEVVGDPKQSIYGFRNADVEVFRRALYGGKVLTPLNNSYRHASVITKFLNHMTATFAENKLGFRIEEAPVMKAEREEPGQIEVHWVTGDEGISDLRVHEARVLAERLKKQHEQGNAYNQMAVLARSYAGLSLMEEALERANIPHVLLQGRGYYERIEIRDLYHALKVGIDPTGLSFAAWLRSPFAALNLGDVDRILRADEPIDQLRLINPAITDRLEKIAQQVRGTPIDALKFLIREPFLEGKRYVDFLSAHARENVDALLFTVAQQPPGEIEFLLDRLDLLSRQSDAGDVPQSGDGVQLLTVHRAKGLEWNVVAVFDLGRSTYHAPQLLYIDPDGGGFALQDSPNFEAIKKRLEFRAEEESYRLLYVAASRARDSLLLSGSIKKGKATGWAAALAKMKLGAESKPYNRSDFLLQIHPYTAVDSAKPPSQQKAMLEPAPYIDTRFHRYATPPVVSPSFLKKDDFVHEPLFLPDPEEGEVLPGRATTVGTLTHYAISQNWTASNSEHLTNLKAQEVMFPFSEEEQSDILQEVKMLLENYEELLGHGIPHPAERSHDQAELPMALPHGKVVWQGIIDRLYKADNTWYLEDYKTDQDIKPEKYYFQLAVYLKAIEEVKQVSPVVRLVFLREKRLVEIAHEVLNQSFSAHT